ncbi:hypothetical protein BJY16_005735 [Actinoplanes octamycinicus]|uniref:DUF5652 domain-containing protein n=1 Tax=Actinoplanes octamycinicus TaxID=135948 RepID=A0A7W7M9V7_9ACTN|nr:hypothetical protein [Actinoplanes octamycinicus]MBB4742276.1 hypothetical protein [Actinoplanes octamycinicus]GIE59879.1 hypothetical protein Aoc01nite_52810 [Actinoplanes octamycinicus]
MAKRWQDLSRGQQRVIVGVAAVEAALKVAMLLDLKRRPGDQVRGPKWVWASTALVNTGGLVQGAYFLFGRVLR